MNDQEDFTWCGEGALVTRPVGQVRWTSLLAADCAFLDACSAGQPLAQVAEVALASDA